ncbi:uncharacterized protein LOC133531866 [Cydia pomonella]|uniref:uncharacterized protein LOC133531866 n=1 Tax=Cydia pomonella TaxID=82600 RepID=UPI002ADE1033|nr:uncharacterized protein LOC133531866 [Cydia pomonella]
MAGQSYPQTSKMASKRNRTTHSCRRCEDKGERWSYKVYRELLEFGHIAHCKMHLCSKMKERLDHHRMSCPAFRADSRQTVTARPQGKHTIDQASSTARNTSIGVSTRRMNPQKKKPRINSVQTSFTFNDLIPSFKKDTEIQSAQTDLTYIKNTANNEANQTEKENDRKQYGTSIKLNDTREGISDPIKRNKTREDPPRRNEYSNRKTEIEVNETHKALSNPKKQNETYEDQSRKSEYRDQKTETVLDESHEDISKFLPMEQSETRENKIRRHEYSVQLNAVIHEFFHDIPVFPNTSEEVKQKRLHIIVDFVDRIADLFIFINDEDYYDKLERKIEECLQVLPMWEPKSKQDKLEFKNYLEDRLFTIIKTFNKKWHGFKIKRKENIEKEIINFAQNYLKSTTEKGVLRKKLIKKINPILESGINEKHAMREEIVNILEELSPYLQLPRDKDVNVLAGDLTKLLSDSEEKYEFGDEYKYTKDNVSNDYQLGEKAEDEIISEITNIMFAYDDIDMLSNRRNVVREIRRILKLSGGFSDSETSSLAKTLITNVRGCFDEDIQKDYTKNGGYSHSNSVLVLTSEQDLTEKSDPPFHSTPKNHVRNKEIPRLNKAEKKIIEKVSAIIRTWLDTTDVSFETMEEQTFKETVVDDMANDVHSLVKQIVQLQVPGGPRINETALNKIILKGIRKYDLFTRPMTGESAQVVDLRQRIMALDTDDLLDKSEFLEPQHGNRQAMENIKFRNANDMRNDPDPIYRPNTLDILEDNISVWMNEQPSDVYKPCDNSTKHKLMREVATNIQEKIINKSSDSDIKNELKQWLNKIVKPQMLRNVDVVLSCSLVRHLICTTHLVKLSQNFTPHKCHTSLYVDGLAENLKDRIVKLPQDETLNRVHQKRIDKQNEDIEAEDKLTEFVDKYIRRYNINDDVVNGVLKLMLYRELYKMSPTTREELYINSSNDDFNTDEFRKELEISIEINDWLKNIPFYYPLLKPGRETIEFVHILARNIANIEFERIKYPNKMNYNSWLYTQIATYMLQKEAAIANDEDKLKIDHYAGQLYMRIINLRKDEENTDELCKIITEHMKKYDTLLAKDYLKKILWRRRLADNVKKLLLENPAASRAEVEKALAMTTLPRDDSVFKYKMEIKYNITIHDWLHAFPLVPPKDNEEEHIRKNKIQELLQKIIETDERKADHPDETRADDDLDNYIASWISQLQFEEDADINIPVMISQLRSGLEYIKWSEIQPKQTSEHGLTRSIYVYMSRQHSNICSPKQKDPGEQMVEAIENWCNNLPIKEESNEATKAKKEQVAINIFQILGSLNDDSRLAYDNKKLKNILDNEIEAQLENLSQHKGINKNKEKLKGDLVNKIMEIKTMIRDITAGDDYVQTLENTIDASLPNPHHRSTKYDPSYELFKKRMVMLWLLENYDYAVDYHSMKYKKMLSKEVRTLSEEVQNRNLMPADKDEMMNDIMSAFYTANPPNEDAIVDEIENIKLRCEIEIWANELPLKEASNYNKVLERDQILTILSKLLFDIVKREECDAGDKMRLEIIKWTQKLPLISGEKINVTKYAELLMCFLKATADSRKCQRQPEPKNLTVVEETLINLKSDDAVLSKTNMGNTSQIAGPSNHKSCGGCGGCGASLEQLAFLMNKAIVNWCAQLPLRYGVCGEHNVVQSTKGLISQRLFRFVSELNYRPNTLNNEGLYEYHLNLEIERILTQLANDRAYWEEQRSRNERKYQLINALKAIRPLVQEVKDRELYKEKLKHTISSFHESMAQHSGVELNENTQMAILDDFIQYNNHKGDFENQELYKLKINNTLNNALNEDVDPLLTANRLICELSKVEFPAQSAKQRRYSEPNPIAINNLPSAPVLRRHSLPPLQNSNPRFVKSQNVIPHEQLNMPIPGPSSYPQRAPLSTSLSAPRHQRPPDFRRSLPLTSEAFPPPLSQELPVLYRASALDIRQFPLPPELDLTNDSHVYQSPVRGPQKFYRAPENQQNSVREFAEQSFHEREPIVEQQILSENTGARVRTWNGPRSSPECPEEWRGGENRLAGQEYCETCDRDDDCAYYMPYPPRMDYMYF